MENLPDYYAILQVHPSAQQEVIEAAYRRLARIYHPDMNPCSDANRKMAALNQAHAVLSNPEQRAAYDARREEERHPWADAQAFRAEATSVKPLTKVAWWRWLLVIPAFVVGLFIPGLLIRFSWELGTSWVPGMDTLMVRWSELLQSGADGFCAVYFATTVAPRGKVAISIAAVTVIAVVFGGVLAASLLFTTYYEGVSTGTILWNSGLIVVSIATAGYAVWYTVQAKSKESP